MTRFCNCGAHVCTNLISRRTKVLAKAREKVIVYGIETQTSNMLGTKGVELTNFVNPELSWKTATKGFRTSRKGTRIWANSVLGDARSPQRDWSSVSESEKHGVAVLGRRFSEQVQHVPLKKRRLLHHSSSSPARNQSPSLKSKQNKTRHGKVASGQCCSPDLECLPDAVTLDHYMVAVFSPKDVDKCLKDGKPPKSMCREVPFDFSGIDLLATTACSSMIDDIGDAKDESIAYQSSTAKITDAVASMQLLKESVSSVDAADEFVEDPSPEQQRSDIPSAELQRAADVYAIEVINQSASVKYKRLHWDLNTPMEAWDQPFDDLILNLQNDALIDTNGGIHSEKLQKMEGSGLCRDPEHSLVPLGQSPVDNFASSGPSAEIFKVCSSNSVMQTREESPFRGGESQIKHDVYSGKVSSDEDVNREEDFREPSHFPDILKTAETCQTVNGEYSVNKIGIRNSSCKLFEQGGGDLCLLGTTGGETQLGQSTNVLLQSNKSPDKSTLSSVVSNVVNGSMDVNEKQSEAQTGYESPFEDGELREDDALFRGKEENEIEGEIIDSLDSEDDEEVKHNNSSNFFPPESSSPECQNTRKGNSPESVVQEGIGEEDMMELTQSASSNTKHAGRDLQLPEVCKASCDISISTNAISSSRRNFVNNSIDESLDGKDVSAAAECVPKVSGGKRLFSDMERLSRFDVIHWKDAVYANKTGSCTLDESSALALEQRETGSDKCLRRVNSSFQQQERDHKDDDDCVGSSPFSYWDSRDNHHYKGAYGGPFRTRLLPGSKEGGGDYIERRRTVSTRDDTTRSRSRGFTRRSSRNDSPPSATAPDDLTALRSLPHNRGGHGISPVHHVRGADFPRPHRKSRSRSRTRSPPVWDFPRKRYRLPYDEDNFLPSGRFSSNKHHHSKWNDDSDRISSRSPGRMSKRNLGLEFTKFDEEQFHPGRRGVNNNYNYRIGSRRNSFVDYDRRKQHGGDKYEMIHRVRQYDDTNSGVVRRQFRYEGDNDFDDARNNININDENRYIRSSYRNERGQSFRCRDGRTYTSYGPKFSAIRNYDDDEDDVSTKQR